MPNDPPANPPQRNRDWVRTNHGLVRRWARRIAGRDRSAADDLEQAALLSILRTEHLPAEGAEAAWVAQVLRRQRAATARSEQRRHRLEAEVAGDGEETAAVEVAEWQMLRREVRTCVQRLREPYRTTLLLRYYEGLPPRAIAARQDVALRTVNKRIERGLKLLRSRLAGAQRRPWKAILLWRPWRRLVPAGAVLSIVAVAASWPLWRADSAPTGPRAPSATASGGDPAPAAARGPSTSDRVATTANAANRPDQETATARTLRGRVVDLTGAPRAGITVRFAAGRMLHDPMGRATFVGAEPAIATEVDTDAQGHFSLPVPTGASGRVRTSGTDTATLLGLSVGADAALTDEVELVAGDAVTVRGRVLGSRGLDCVVALPLPRQAAAARLARNRRLALENPWVRCDRDGAFAFDAVALAEGQHITVQAAGLPEQSFALTGRDPQDLRLALRETALPLLGGTVLDDRGQPLAEALVGCGDVRVRTRADGSFRIAVSPRAAECWALADGWSADRLPLRRGEPDDVIAAGVPVTLRLTETAASIRGLVRWPDGTPAAGVAVFAENPVIAGDSPSSLFLETYLGGGGPVPQRVFTDARGRFELPHLLRRNYRLAAIDPKTLAKGLAPRTPAGSTGVEVQLDSKDLVAVEGRLSFRDGAPASGTVLRLRRVMLLIPFPSGQRLGATLPGPTATTKADGSYTLHAPRGADLLATVADPDLFADTIPIDTSNGPVHRDLVVSRRLPLCVRVTSSALDADSFELLDGNRRLPLWEDAPDNSNSLQRLGPRAELVRGQPRWVIGLDIATAIVFFRGDEEVARQPVQLRAGQDNVLDF